MGSKDKENTESASTKNESNGKLVLPENMIWGYKITLIQLMFFGYKAIAFLISYPTIENSL